MVFRKRQNGQDVSTSKKMYRRKRKMRGGLNRTQLRQVRQEAKKAIHVEAEKKVSDSLLASSSAPFSSPYLNNETVLSVGTGNGARIGDEVAGQYITLRGAVRGNASSTNSNTYWRILVFRWLDNATENVPTVEDLFGTVSTGNAEVFKNYDVGEKKSFQVLIDKRGMISASSANSENDHLIDISIPLKSNKVHWDGGAVSNGHIWTLFWTSEPTASTPAFEYFRRFAYTDS